MGQGPLYLLGDGCENCKFMILLGSDDEQTSLLSGAQRHDSAHCPPDNAWGGDLQGGLDRPPIRGLLHEVD